MDCQHNLGDEMMIREHWRETNPLMDRIGDCSAISTIVPRMSSSSRNGNPPRVEPMLPWMQTPSTTSQHPRNVRSEG